LGRGGAEQSIRKIRDGARIGLKIADMNDEARVLVIQGIGDELDQFSLGIGRIRGVPKSGKREGLAFRVGSDWSLGRGNRGCGNPDDGGQERVLVQFTIAVFGLLVEALRLNVSRLSLPR